MALGSASTAEEQLDEGLGMWKDVTRAKAETDLDQHVRWGVGLHRTFGGLAGVDKEIRQRC
jgi:hypothetical protein